VKISKKNKNSPSKKEESISKEEYTDLIKKGGAAERFEESKNQNLQKLL
jgi:hypothetical protein